MNKLEYKYIQISEINSFFYSKSTERLQKIMIAKGVTTEMFSEMMEWESKNKRTERSKKQIDRLILLEEALNEFSECASQSDQVSVIVGNKNREINFLKSKIEILEKQLEQANIFYDKTV